MASGVDELLDMLFEMIDEARNAPFSNDKCIIERDRALDLIDDIRGQFPMELEEAKKLIATRAEMIASAKREADSIRKAAEDRARQLLAEQAIFQAAKARANEMIQQAEQRSRDLKISAHEFCEDALRRTEEAVAETYDDIKKSRARFRSIAGMGAPSSSSGGSSSRSIYNAAADEN